MDDLKELLLKLLDYMSNRADADYQGEETGFVYNEEAKLASEINEQLNKL